MVRALMRTLRAPISPLVASRALVFAMALSACKSRPSDLREWRATDHTHEEGEGQTDPNLPPVEDNDPLVAAMGIWQAQCATCHGESGRGDGPQASLTHPADLTSPTFQAGRTDDQIRATITRGRNMMPAFGNALRPEGITVLVQLVRQFGHAGAP